jgi:4-amino-4-deoxy-L-arabinose transferase-like glycosyltransferase
VLRLRYLAQPMRYDEAYAYTNTVAQGLRHVLTRYDAPNNHVFHSALVWASVKLFGGEPWALRLPAFAAGVLLVPASYLAGRALYGRGPALVAAALVASLAELVVFSTDARGYTIVALAFMLLVALAARLKRTRSPAAWPAFAVVAAFGGWTVPTALYPVGGVALWLAASAAAGDTAAPRGRVVRDLALSLAGAGALAALLYAPVIFRGTGLRSLVANRYVVAAPPSEFWRAARELPGLLWADWTLGVPPWAHALVAAGAAAGLLLHRRVARDRVPLWAAVLIWCGALLLVVRRDPGIRIWLFLVPLVALVAGAGLATLVAPWFARLGERRRAAAAALLPAALAFGVALHAARTDAVFDPALGDTATFRDAPEVAAYLASRLAPGDRVLAQIPTDAPLEFYMGRAGIPAGFLAWDSMRSTELPRLAGSQRLVVVVNPLPWYPQSTESVLRDQRVDPSMVAAVAPPVPFPHGASIHLLRWAR